MGAEKRASPPIAPAGTTQDNDSGGGATLHYVTDTTAGIRRRRSAGGFRYIGTDGAPVREATEQARIRALAVPPAWTNVWICPDPLGHLQATGRDARGRKQYRYHPSWRRLRDDSKFERTIAFGAALPGIRKQVDRDLRRRGLPYEKVVATVVLLLEKTLIRVGNEEYARTNRSFGLTTLRTRHVSVSGTSIRFRFTGKSGVKRTVELRDPRLARVVQACQAVPGHAMFQYLDEEGRRRVVTSADVNAYLKAVAGQDFTAKDFRTWSATVLAATSLCAIAEFDTKAMARRNIVAAIASVARQLGNTAAICRKSYVHPGIIDAYQGGRLATPFSALPFTNGAVEPLALTPAEQAVLALLRQDACRQAQGNDVATGASAPKSATTDGARAQETESRAVLRSSGPLARGA